MEFADWIADTAPPSHADSARTLLEQAESGVLASLEDSGHPYASIVEVMPHGNDIILFLSNLASHTRNVKADPRVSLVVREQGEGERLALGRATFQGHIAVDNDRDELAELWVHRHPGASNYVGFKDFSFYRIDVERVRYIAGFGRMGWVDEERWALAQPDPLCDIASGIIEHMNSDHSHNLLDYGHAFAQATWATEARMTGLDSNGFELSLMGADREESTRIGFANPRTTSDEIHETMVRLARLARQALDSEESS